jgi:hypothetical protein
MQGNICRLILMFLTMLPRNVDLSALKHIPKDFYIFCNGLVISLLVI